MSETVKNCHKIVKKAVINRHIPMSLTQPFKEKSYQLGL